jgi:hypothetical protein
MAIRSLRAAPRLPVAGVWRAALPLPLVRLRLVERRRQLRVMARRRAPRHPARRAGTFARVAAPAQVWPARAVHSDAEALVARA